MNGDLYTPNPDESSGPPSGNLPKRSTEEIVRTFHSGLDIDEKPFYSINFHSSLSGAQDQYIEGNIYADYFVLRWPTNITIDDFCKAAHPFITRLEALFKDADPTPVTSDSIVSVAPRKQDMFSFSSSSTLHSSDGSAQALQHTPPQNGPAKFYLTDEFWTAPREFLRMFDVDSLWQVCVYTNNLVLWYSHNIGKPEERILAVSSSLYDPKEFYDLLRRTLDPSVPADTLESTLHKALGNWKEDLRSYFSQP